MDGRLMTVDRVLVPVDGSPLSLQAVPYALSLIRHGGTITILRVIASHEASAPPFGDARPSEQERLARQPIVSALERWPGVSPVRVKIVVEQGDPADKILAAARAQQAGLIVMATSARGALGRLAVGSVADRVIRSSPVPVVVIRRGDALTDMSLPLIRRLVVAVDGSRRSLEAVPVVEALAKHLRASVLLVTVLDPLDSRPPALQEYPRDSGEPRDDAMAAAKSEAGDLLARTAGRFADAGVSADWKLLTGQPATAINETVLAGDFVVLTSRGHGGLRRWLLGSVAEQLVRQCPAPVVIVPSRLLDGDDPAETGIETGRAAV